MAPKTDLPDELDDDALDPAWQWVAIVVLILCWVVEATLCAGRGV